MARATLRQRQAQEQFPACDVGEEVSRLFFETTEQKNNVNV